MKQGDGRKNEMKNIKRYTQDEQDDLEDDFDKNMVLDTKKIEKNPSKKALGDVKPPKAGNYG